MKKVIVLLVALVGMTSAKAQWVPLNSGTNYNLNSVYFTDINTGFVVGDSAIILKTTNCGNTWEMVPSGIIWEFIRIDLKSIFFIDYLTGYIAGGTTDWHGGGVRGVILNTADGGETWEIIYDGGWSFKSIFFTSSIIGYGIAGNFCSNGSLLQSNDGGNNWTSLQYPQSRSSVFFVNDSTGYVVGDNGIEKTIDGGVTCIELLSGINYSLKSIDFINEESGFVVGDNGIILKTITAGEQWTLQESGTTLCLNSVHMQNFDTSYIAGDSGTILKTTNGGNTWIKQYTGTANQLKCIYFINENVGYAVGSDGSILKTTNGGGTMGIYEEEQTALLKIYPNPTKNKITISSHSIAGNTNLSIFSVSGEKLLVRQLTNTEIQIDISFLPRGVYFVRVQSEKTVEVAKMVKE